MQLYNTLTRKKEEFVPVRPGKVNMYVCGITAYDYCHIGHARSALVFDVLVRHLRALGLDVTFVRNFTDVDDKIIRRANEEKRDWREVGQTYIDAFHEDMDRLNVVRADHEPRATEYIQQMQDLCSELIAQGKAYAVPSGDVYFRVRAYPPYGKLSGRSLDELQAGARVAPGEEKQDPLDFALWKAAKPGEPFWESPWGKGRPGWHIECSAMSRKYLGLPLDIHGGGADLVFPHHENETAQSEAAYGETFCNYWMHGGMLQINKEKMSKSLGNFLLLRDVLKTTRPAVLRMLMLQTHYRSPLDFSDTRLQEAEASLNRIENTVKNLDWLLSTADEGPATLDGAALKANVEQLRQGFVESMDDDFNTAGALGCLFSFVNDLNAQVANRTISTADAGAVTEARDAVIELLGVLGIQAEGKEEGASGFPAETVELAARLAGYAGDNAAEAAQALLDARATARKAKDFGLADAIRDGLTDLGFTVEDTPQGARVTYEG